MSREGCVRVGVVLGLLVVGAAGGWASAQSVAPRAVVPPRVVAGEDVGFRIEGQRGNAVVGRIVVRLNGEWVETETATGPFHLLHGSQ